ncbi:DNA-binding protein [Eikenella sp. NML96-A-049]|uniref:DNA-binding protein n=1 Tax=Eikenella sp. NML96-A-049 TaxID=1809061 RepID=UPI0007E087FA|nr:DNA-binding protein [Eikenella sp. NML96-A-049]OAM38888.1 DNA-binding protein [Eikenella sp. NML96-A-049]
MDTQNSKAKFAEKLKIAMQARGYEAKASVLEREFNLRHFGKPVTLHGAAKWLRGEALPRHDKIATLAKWLKMNPDELVYGLEVKEETAGSRRRWEESIGYRERELLEIFLNLPAPQRKIVREVILAFGKAYSVEND